MTKEQRLFYCTQCTNRGFDRNLGVVCKLTKAEPAFEISCADYSQDVAMLTQMEQRRKDQEIIDSNNSLSPNTNAGIIWGIIMMAGAVVWFVLGYMAGYIFFYPPVLLIIGLIAVFKGIQKQKQLIDEKRKNNIDVIDNLNNL